MWPFFLTFYGAQNCRNTIWLCLSIWSGILFVRLGVCPQNIMKYKWRYVLPKVYSLHNLNYLVAEGGLIYGLGFAVRAYFTIAWSLVLVFTRSFFSISKQALWCFHPFLLHLSSVYYHRFIYIRRPKPSLVFYFKKNVCYRWYLVMHIFGLFRNLEYWVPTLNGSIIIHVSHMYSFHTFYTFVTVLTLFYIA